MERLHLVFTTQAPSIDETARATESPEQLVLRLAQEKAWAVAQDHSSALIIGSDQVAWLESAMIGKPGHFEAAVEQLMRSSGKTIIFYTGLCLLNTQSGCVQTHCEMFKVTFRHLTRQEIERYLQLEQPWNCAGSFKSEGYGITLFESMEGSDPSSLIGLPLIQLCRMLRHEGIEVP